MDCNEVNIQVFEVLKETVKFSINQALNENINGLDVSCPLDSLLKDFLNERRY